MKPGPLRRVTPKKASDESLLRALLSRERAIVSLKFPVIGVVDDPTTLVVESEDYELEPLRNPAKGSVGAGLAALSRLVCRIDLLEGGVQSHCGSGVLVAPDVVLSCRHVAAAFARPAQDGTWALRAGKKAMVVTDAVPDPHNPRGIAVAYVLFAGGSDSTDLAFDRNEPEIAVLRLEKPVPWLGDDVADMVNWDADDTFAQQGQALAVISYPGVPFVQRDGKKSFADLRIRGVKVAHVESLFEPGGVPLYGRRCVTLGDSFRFRYEEDIHELFCGHTCSTLGGSSGGAVVDLTNVKLIGIHCGGVFADGNQFQSLTKARKSFGERLHQTLLGAGIPGYPPPG